MSTPSLGDKHLQAAILFVVAVESLFLVFLTVFLFNHANPKGDGMEMVAVGAAFTLIFLPLSLPAYLLAKNGRFLILAAFLAGLVGDPVLSCSGSRSSTSSVSKPRPGAVGLRAFSTPRPCS